MSENKVENNVFIPMPMALVGTMIGEKPNFMAVGWITRANANPPMIGIGIHKTHQTASSIKDTGYFSACFPSERDVVKADYCGLVSGRNMDKASLFEVFYGTSKKAPLIRNFSLNLAMKVVETVELPSNCFFIGEIVDAYAPQEMCHGSIPDVRLMDLLMLTMPDNTYWTLGEKVADARKCGNAITRQKPSKTD